MKLRTLLYIAIGFLILGIALFTFSTRGQEPAQIYPATVNRDCAPWDGAAFTVSIPYQAGVVITISIWQSPDIVFPTMFSFPDETGQTGSAYILPELDPLEPLSGQVTFQRVEQGKPVEGRFSFTSERGRQVEGAFVAEWENEAVYCG